jgi:uncharacterized Tic20 family protein
MKLSDAERERAVEPVKAAYADGRLDDEEFQRRLDGVMGARTRGELVPLLHDLPNAYGELGTAGAPGPAGGTAAPETFRAAGGVKAPGAVRGGERSWAVAAHALGLCTSFVGPLLISRSGAARRSDFVRRQAVEAANFQLTALGAVIATGVFAGVTFGVGAVLFAPLMFLWFVMTCVGAARAVDGLEFRHPVTLRLLS